MPRLSVRKLSRAKQSLFIAAIGLTTILVDCRTANHDNSQVLSSGTSAYNGFVSLFTKTVGRKPQGGATSPDFALYDADPEKMADKILASDQFTQEGFFNIHRDRLVLQLYQQSPEWIAGEHASYCALKKEMRDVAKQDAAGDAGYWSILSYQERWLPLPAALTNCIAGTSYAELKKVFPATPATPGGGFGGGFGDDDDSTGPAPVGAAAVAKSCAAGIYALGTYRPDYIKLVQTAAAENDAKAPIDTADGAKIIAGFLASKLKPGGAAVPDPNGVDVQISLSDGGRPQLTEEFDPAKKSDSCSFRELPADMAGYAPSPATSLMVHAKLSPKLVGVMANPFWLARHPTNQKNRGLHRARLVMFSYMCKEVSPAAAELAGGPAVEVPELVKYFPVGDEHAKASQSCYNCHSNLQPIANFFSALEKNDTNFGGTPDLKFFQSNATQLPGGYWTFSGSGAGSFFGKQGTQYDVNGLQGLANIFSDKTFPAAAQCVVTSAWASLFGSEHAIPDAFRAEALAKFQAGNAKGAASLTEAIRYILKSPYGKTYFSASGGPQAFETLLKGSDTACQGITTDDAMATVKTSCYGCHNTKKMYGVAFFKSPEKTPLEITEQYRQKAYCRVKNEEMPPEDPLEMAAKAKALCYLKPQLSAAPMCGAAVSAAAAVETPVHTMPDGAPAQTVPAQGVPAQSESPPPVVAPAQGVPAQSESPPPAAVPTQTEGVPNP